jgi:hypothetical protein
VPQPMTLSPTRSAALSQKWCPPYLRGSNPGFPCRPWKRH